MEVLATLVPSAGAGARGLEKVTYGIKLFAGFYPEVSFVADKFAPPNIRAFTAYDRASVVVAGGLWRLLPLEFEGLAILIAIGVAGTRPGITVEGAIGVGIGSVLPTAFYEVGAVVVPGRDQIGSLLDMLEAGGPNGSGRGTSGAAMRGAIDAAVAGLLR